MQYLIAADYRVFALSFANMQGDTTSGRTILLLAAEQMMRACLVLVRAVHRSAPPRALLGRRPRLRHDREPADAMALLPSDDTGFRIRSPLTLEQKAGRNQMHFDLTSTSLADQRQVLARARGLGADSIDVGQRPDEGHVVFADPKATSSAFSCRASNFLADCGFLTALSCDGTQEVGVLLAAELGWPLVWDQDQETTIRSTHGSPKITRGGASLMPKRGKNRLRLDLAPSAGANQEAEVDRLLSLGATGLDIDQGGDSVAIADFDGNEFCLLAVR